MEKSIADVIDDIMQMIEVNQLDDYLLRKAEYDLVNARRKDPDNPLSMYIGFSICHWRSNRGMALTYLEELHDLTKSNDPKIFHNQPFSRETVIKFLKDIRTPMLIDDVDTISDLMIEMFEQISAFRCSCK